MPAGPPQAQPLVHKHQRTGGQHVGDPADQDEKHGQQIQDHGQQHRQHNAQPQGQAKPQKQAGKEEGGDSKSHLEGTDAANGPFLAAYETPLLSNEFGSGASSTESPFCGGEVAIRSFCGGDPYFGEAEV